MGQSIQLIFIASLLMASLGAQAKMSCVSKELKLMSCKINYKKANYILSRQALRIHDGTWRGVYYWPDSEPVKHWHTMKIRPLGGKRFLVTKVWKKEPSVPSLDLESLHWIVYEINGIQVEQRIDKVIQKRRRGAGTKEQPAGRYLTGKLESHILKVQDKDVIWKMGHSKGSLIHPESDKENEE